MKKSNQIPMMFSRAVNSYKCSLFLFVLMSLTVTSCFAQYSAQDADLNSDGVVSLYDLAAIYENIFNSGEAVSGDINNDQIVDFRDFSILACFWLEECSTGQIVWVAINEAGFTGDVSKYETTNSQYCNFLNSAIGSGDISVSGTTILGLRGSNGGLDYSGQKYYDLAGAGSSNYGANAGGAARINFINGVFTVDEGFENHPVTYVSWYGADAFCNYFGYRLPSEAEWKAVADYDGSYTYGCGTSIDVYVANYQQTSHLDGTVSVLAFSEQGYGISDMAGNACEWTSTVSARYKVHKGGGWSDLSYKCSIGFRGAMFENFTYYNIGFRAFK